MPLVASRANASAKAFGWSSAPSAETLGGMVLMTPTSIASTGTGNSSSINANGSVTFSSCETLSLNGVFTSEYDNYMIVIRGVGSSDQWAYLRLRASGTDNVTASSYTYQNLNVDSTAVSGGRTTTDKARAYDSSSTQRYGVTINLFGPYLAQPTAGRSIAVSSYLNAGIYEHAFTHNQSTSYDGFTTYPASGTITGLVSVYGLGG